MLLRPEAVSLYIACSDRTTSSRGHLIEAVVDNVVRLIEARGSDARGFEEKILRRGAGAAVLGCRGGLTSPRITPSVALRPGPHAQLAAYACDGLSVGPV